MRRAYQDLRLNVHGREGGMCARCGCFTVFHPGFGASGHCHHRQLRSRGGADTAWNCVWVCGGCHDWIHANPKDSTETGYMCPSWEDPARWSVKRGEDWQQPTPDGWVPAAQPRTVEAS